MKKLYLILIFFSLLAFKVSNAQENFASPIVIGELVGNYDCIPYSNSQNTCAFANDVLGVSNDVVYQFTVSAGATVVMDMCSGTSYDSYLYLCDAGQAVIASNDDFCGAVSYLSYTIVTPGTYYIVVEGYSTDCGSYTLQVSIPDVIAPVPDVATLADITGDGTVNITAVPTATDNCSGSITATTTDPLTYSTPGTYIVNWSYVDGSGNTSTQTQTVIVYPSPIVIGELIGNYDCGLPAYSDSQNSCLFTDDLLGVSKDAVYEFTVSAGATVVMDMCTGTSYDSYLYLCDAGMAVIASNDDFCGAGYSYLSHTIVTPGTYYIVVEGYSTGCGNYTLQVSVPNAAPIPDLATLPDVTGECVVTVATTPTATDCATPITGTTTDPLTYSTQGTSVITWSYDDGAGFIVTQTQNVIVDDVTVPVPDVASLADVTGDGTVNVAAPTATDNCVGAITATTTDPITYSVPGTYSITWTYDDGNGNITTQTQTVIVFASPIVIGELIGNYDCGLPAYSDSQNSCLFSDDLLGVSKDAVYEFTVSAGATVVMDMCTGTSYDSYLYLCDAGMAVIASNDDFCGVGYSYLSHTIVTPGTYYIVVEGFSSDCGNYTLQVSASDVTPPLADVATLPDVLGECDASVSTTPTATDACTGAVTGTTTDALTYNTQGTHVITWTYNDGIGNTSTQTQNVVIDDITAPVADAATLPDVLGECDATVSTTPTATDACSGAATGTTTDALTYNTQGTHVITWTYDDGNGNIATQTQNVVIDDITAPLADVASLVDVTGECSVDMPTAPTATDLCAGVITGTTTTIFPVTASTVVTWTYDDGNGNIATQDQNVVIDDISAPVADVATLSDVTGECSVDMPTAPTATDLCVGVITGTTTTIFPVTASTIITWTYDDGNGNIATQDQNIVIDDISAPVADVASLSDVTGECSVDLPTAPTATDLCEGVITGTTTTIFPVTASTVITWTYDDGNGNIATQDQNIVIDDISAPVADVATLSDVTGECSVDMPTAPTATDLCEGVITGTTTTIFPVTASTVITWTYDDGNGNIATQTQNVVIDDISAPVADVASLSDVTDECSVDMPTAPTATDLCVGVITGTTTTVFPVTTQGTTVITWTYDDGNGNISTQDQNVVLEDVTIPEIACVGDLIINLNDGETSYVVVGDEIDPSSATDNCILDALINSFNSGATLAGENLAIGTHNIEWTATDMAGNIDTCVTIVIVNPYVGINNLNASGYNVYPNPSEGTVYVSLENNSGALIIVRDAIGRVVIEKQANTNLIELDLNDVQSGAYTIEINSGDTRSFAKIIIK